MHSSNNMDHNQNFIKLHSHASWTGTEAATKKIDRKRIINRAYLAFFSMLISIIITQLILLIHYKNQFHLSNTYTSNLNQSTLTIVNGLNQTQKKLCISDECIRSSAYLLDRIDPSVDPCDDFYQYSCGKFLESKTVPDDHVSRNILQEIQDEIYIEMKNYLERQIEEEDELTDSADKLSTDKQLTDKQLSDSRIDVEQKDKNFDHKQINDRLDEHREKLTNKEQLNNQQTKQPLNEWTIMEELDQDRFLSSTTNEHNLTTHKISKELNAVRKVKMFYRSSMNESTVNDEPTSVNVILNLIYEYGGEWSLLSENSYPNKTFKQIKSIQDPTYRFDGDKSTKNKLEARIYSVFLHQIQPIFHFYVAPEEFRRNSKDYAIHLYSGSTILESSYFINSTVSNDTAAPTINYRDAYTRLQLDILIRLAAIKGRSINETNARLEIKKIVAFEADLANITKLFSENSTTQNEDIITADMNTTKNNLQNESNLNSNLPITSNYSGESIPPTLNSQQQRSKTSYIRLNLTTLALQFDFIDWRYLFKQMEKNSARKIDEILLENTDYLEQIKLLFKRHKSTTIDNYLCWATIARFLPYLGSTFRRTFTDFRRKIPDPPTLTNDLQQIEEIETNLFNALNLLDNKNYDADGVQLLDRYKRKKKSASTSGRMFLSRWKECVHLASEGLKKPIAILYLQEKRDYVEKISKKVEIMVDNIKDAFLKIVDKQDWLINDTIKDMVKQRAQSMKSKIGFPRYLMNLEKADEQFKDLEIKLDDVFVTNIIKMVRHEIKGELKLLNEKIDPDKDWMIDTLIPNAYYDAMNHFIILPVAILRSPLISLRRPMYLDYASLGVVIGHELSHAFDTGTRKELNSGLTTLNNKTASNNVNTNWWPKELNMEYENKSQCFVRQFNNYSVNEINKNLNGNLTLEENICDFSGFQQAYYAYILHKTDEDDVLLPGLTHLTPEQLFFVQYAQVWCEISNKEGYKKALLDSHSPGRFRANGIVSNSKQYSNAFKCEPDKLMNLANKCDLRAY